MAHIIEAVQPHGIAYRRGIRAGDSLVAINGENILDEIDYQALTNRSRLDIDLIRADGTPATVRIIKAKDAPLGLRIADTLACTPRQCKNKCVFCFIDQMPPGMRETLYVKDDDWRLSLMMGNFITLTNVDDREFDRILRRKASPLYISVHATDPDVRVRMMKNPNARSILDRLNALRDHGIKFHCQIVLCPGWNDGDILRDTLRTLTSLWPAAQSAALVPVGLTKFRDRLEKLRPYTREEAQAVLSLCDEWQARCLRDFGTRFVFPSDEMLCIAGRALPEEDFYENYPQIENGVGLMRQFLSGFISASRNQADAPAHARRVVIPCGVSIAPYMQKWIDAYGPRGVSVRVQPIVNHFFGETVTVTGLLTGRDILEQLEPGDADEMLLCSVTLREAGDLFLDDMPLADFRAALPLPLTIVPNRGDALYAALLG
ncbi:MAG: DUF512 domain-containing protein [Clostridia bacterium]|nr:DUF512 domain-containing protein [Clostridia bacterium]